MSKNLIHDSIFEQLNAKMVPQEDCLAIRKFGLVTVYITKAGEYNIIEPTINEKAKKIYDELFHDLEYHIEPKSEPDEKMQTIKKALDEEAKAANVTDILMPEYKNLEYYLNRDLVGYKKLDVLMKDPNIEDIICNGAGKYIGIVDKIFSEFKHLRTNIKFADEKDLQQAVRKILHGLSISPSKSLPMIYAAMKEKHRLTIGWSDAVTRPGTVFYIRKFPAVPYTVMDLLDKNALSELMAAYIWIMNDAPAFYITFGQVSTGKTTLINALMCMNDPLAHIVTIEDTQELQIPHYWTDTYITKISPNKQEAGNDIEMDQLIKLSLRAEPNFVIIGEVRGKEAVEAFRSAQTGHGGALSYHAENPWAAISRLTSDTHGVTIGQLRDLWFMIHNKKFTTKDGKKIRRISGIYEIVPQDTFSSNRTIRDEIDIVTAFEYDQLKDRFLPDNVDDLLAKKLFRLNVAKEQIGITDLKAEILKRVEIIQKCRGVAKTPDEVLKMLGQQYYKTQNIKTFKDRQ